MHIYIYKMKETTNDLVYFCISQVTHMAHLYVNKRYQKIKVINIHTPKHLILPRNPFCTHLHLCTHFHISRNIHAYNHFNSFVYTGKSMKKL